MVDPALWTLMQRVESLRYRADVLERIAAALTSPTRDQAIESAKRLRQAAERLAVRGCAREKTKAT